MSENLNAIAIKVKGFWTNLRIYNNIGYPREEFTRWIIFMKEPPSILEYSQKNMINRFNLDDAKYKTKLVYGLGIEEDINENEVALWEIDTGEIPGALIVSQSNCYQQELSNHQLVQGAFVRSMFDSTKEHLGFAITELIEVKIFSLNKEDQFTIEKRVGKEPNVVFSNMKNKTTVSNAKKRAKIIEEAILKSNPAIRSQHVNSQHMDSQHGDSSDTGSIVVGLFILFAVIMILVKILS